MNFDEKLENYSQLIIRHGLNVQKGQDVYIASEVIHRDFITLLVQAAYQAGARVVQVDLIDPRNTRTRILETQKEEDLSYVPPFIPYRFDSMVPESSSASPAAYVRIIGSEFPDNLADLDPKKVHQMEIGYKRSLKNFYEQGIGQSKVHWNIAAAATPAWGKKVFPELEKKRACEALWEEIFRTCRADKPDCLKLWKEHNKVLATRAKKLTDLKIEYLHFTGPGTDLKVGLMPQARFKGGNSKTPANIEFEPNLPTEECFTTPDYRKTEGKVQTTRPFTINGKLIKGLCLEFRGGEIIHFEAQEGKATFAEYIKSDPGAKRLGEVALVGIDSPIYQSGRIFEEILFDENAACHIAIGFAYRFCLEGSEKLKEEELESVGCNVSSTHLDMMISSEKVDVTAHLYSGSKVALIQEGTWVWSGL